MLPPTRRALRVHGQYPRLARYPINQLPKIEPNTGGGNQKIESRHSAVPMSKTTTISAVHVSAHASHLCEPLGLRTTEVLHGRRNADRVANPIRRAASRRTPVEPLR